jgi:hypothetical protein
VEGTIDKLHTLKFQYILNLNGDFNSLFIEESIAMPVTETKHSVKARVREFGIPPIHDALVLGRKSAIGCMAMRKALSLLVAQPFDHIELKDDIISDILVRSAILRRVPKEKFVEFVRTHIKPMMCDNEVLHLDLDAEVLVENHHL